MSGHIFNTYENKFPLILALQINQAVWGKWVAIGEDNLCCGLHYIDSDDNKFI
jgi:hypothetical protein